MRLITVFCLMIGLAAVGQGQWTHPKSTGLPSTAPLPTFHGTVRGSSAKSLSIDSNDENTMNFICTKKTSWLDGARKVKPEDIAVGELVEVDGRKRPDGSMEAVEVRIQRAKESGKK
jgi:hypothetical protein